MTTTIISRLKNQERSAQGNPGFPSQSPDVYRGTVNGKEFAVEISETDAPRWTGCELDDDEKADVLGAIDD